MRYFIVKRDVFVIIGEVCGLWSQPGGPHGDALYADVQAKTPKLTKEIARVLNYNRASGPNERLQLVDTAYRYQIQLET